MSTLKVSPTSGTVDVGSTLKLAHTVGVDWSTSDASVATVSKTGLVTAVSPGTATITCSVGGLSASSVITVPGTIAPPPPPPPPSGTNEPTGMTVISDRAQPVLNGGGWEDEGNGTIITDSSTPLPYIRTTLPAGFKPGGGTADGNFYFPPKRTVYVSYLARYSANWFGGEAGLDKQFYLYTSTGEPSLVFVASGSGTAKKLALMEGQDILAGGQGYGDAANPDWGPNQGANAEFVRGQWVQVEAVLVGNTSGNADGSIDVFINGVKVISYSGIKFISGNALWNWFHYTNIWTGSSGSVPAAQTVDYSHFYISGK